MLYVSNEYEGDKLTIHSARQGDMTFTVPLELIDEMRELAWCYEQDKAQVYHTDTKRRYVDTLGLKGTRLYLWKWLLWKKFGRIPLYWHRPVYANYSLERNGFYAFVPNA